MAASTTADWHILGAGAVGCLWAASWCLRGQSPTLILRDDDALRRFDTNGGIVLNDRAGHHMFHPAVLTASNLDRPVRRLLIATKAWQTTAALDGIEGRIAADAVIVLLQNGLGNPEVIEQWFPHVRLYSAITTDGVWRERPFTITRTGYGHTAIGRPGVSAPDTVDRRLLQSLPQPPLRIDYSRDIRQQQWHKLAVNCIVNPLTALAGCTNGELTADPEFEHRATALAHEIAAVATAVGIDLDAPTVIDRTRAVIAATAANRSSMLQDFDAGRPTEIDFINGYVWRLGTRLGIDCPDNRLLWQRVRQRETDIR